jgi:thiosulfate dehydrogenase (quinone) large subunit
LALLPVRLFLGVTFSYAGAQKLSDPGFLHPGAATYIGTQLHQFANGTPGGFILRLFAFPAPGFAGVAVALTEIAVGLLTFFGLFTRVAALIGLCLNLLLFLTNSWTTYPYFLGSDIVFVFAWLPFVLTGPTEQPALDHALEQAVARRSAPARSTTRPRPGPDPAITRRSLVARGLGATALMTGVIAGIAALAKGSYRGGATLATLRAPKGHHSPVATRQTTPQHTASKSSGLPAGAHDIGAANQLPPGQAALYHDPADGSPDIVVHESSGRYSAHSAVCTHAGCTVGYSGGQLVCPCHGSIFDAATGAVIQGPAATPLPTRHVIEHDGQLYAVPS